MEMVEKVLLYLVEQYGKDNTYSTPSGIQVDECRIDLEGWKLNISLRATTVASARVASVSDEGKNTTNNVQKVSKVDTFNVSYMQAPYERRGSYNPTYLEIREFISSMLSNLASIHPQLLEAVS